MANNVKKLYVKFGRKNTVKQFLDEYFSINKPDYKGWVSGQETYFDKECTKLHCELGKVRSWDDTWTLVKTYYPSYTKTKLLKALFSINNTNKVLYLSFCGTIGRSTIWYYTTGYSKLNYNYLGILWKNRLSLIGINNKEDFNKLYNDG